MYIFTRSALNCFSYFHEKYQHLNTSLFLFIFLYNRRYKRLKSEASVKRREVSSCHFTLDQGGNILEDDDHYQTIDPEISQYVESSTYKITIDDNCDAGYLTPVGSNDITGYITPIFSKQLHNVSKSCVCMQYIQYKPTTVFLKFSLSQITNSHICSAKKEHIQRIRTRNFNNLNVQSIMITVIKTAYDIPKYVTKSR